MAKRQQIGAANSKTNPHTTLTINITGANTTVTGNTIILCVAVDDNGNPGTDVTASDTQGNTYTRQVQNATTGNGGGQRCAILSAYNHTGLVEGNTITVTHGSVQASACVALEFTNVTSGTVDKTNSANGTTTTPSSGSSGTLTQANELVIGAIAIEDDNVSVTSPGLANNEYSAGTTGGSAITNMEIHCQWEIVSATDAKTCSGTIPSTANRGWTACIATFLQSAEAKTIAIADNLARTDSFARKSDAIRVYTDNLRTQDTPLRQADAIRVYTDTLRLQDTPLRQADAIRAYTDTLRFQDTPLRQADAMRVYADVIAYGEAFLRDIVSAAFTISIADSLRLAPSFSRSSAANRAIGDAIAFNVGFGSRAEYSVKTIPADKLGLQDTPTRSSTANRVVTDTIAFGDALTGIVVVGPGAATIAIVDAHGFSDAVLRRADANRTAVDALGFQDAAFRQVIAYRVMTDTLAFADSVQRSAVSLRAIVDTLAFGDTIQRSTTAQRLITDAIAFADALTGILVVGQGVKTVVVSDALGLLDTINRQASASRSFTEQIGFADAVTRSTTASRSMLDQIGLSDIFDRSITFGRSMLDQIGFLDQPYRSALLFRVVVDSLAFSDLASLYSAIADPTTVILVSMVDCVVPFCPQAETSIPSCRAADVPVPFVDEAETVVTHP